METTETTANQSSLTLSEFNVLVQAANSGDADALAKLRTLLDEQPAIWQRLGDLALHTELTLSRLIAGNDQLLLESVQRKLTELRNSLTRPGASAIERLSVDRVVASWMQLQHIETKLVVANAGTTVARHWRLFQAQTERSHQAALKALLTLQHLVPIPIADVGSQIESPMTSLNAEMAAETPSIIPMTGTG
jgi:hypothetical protein